MKDCLSRGIQKYCKDCKVIKKKQSLIKKSKINERLGNQKEN
jgi:hypothetical protein